MAFTLNFNEVIESNGGRIQDGEYEVIISRAAEGATPGGAEYIEFDLIVRNDVQQDYKDRHIFHKVWRSKKDGKYSMITFNTIGKAAQLQAGKAYSTLEELLADFYHKPLRVYVKNEKSEYNGKEYENTNVKQWMQTKVQGIPQHQFKAADFEKQFGGVVEIKEEQLPF